MRFPLNYETLLEVDITPKATTRTYVRLAEGIATVETSMNEVNDQQSFYADEGYATTRKTGGQLILTVSGSRVTGDAAQDFIAGLFGAFGDDAISNVRLTSSDGEVKSGPATFTGIVAGGGEAGSLGAFSCEIHVNGKPSITPRSVAPALAVTLAVGAVVGATKATATAGEGNSLAYKLAAQSAGTIYAKQYLSGFTAYTSGDDILASAGQYLQVYELDANERVVKFAEEVLEAADINPGT